MEPEEGDRSNHVNLNPMDIDVVIANVLRQARLQDLKALRLVSKKWNQLSLPFFRKSFVISVTGKKPLFKIPEEDAIRWNVFGPAASLLEYMSMYLDPRNQCLAMPHQRFSLKWWLMFHPRLETITDNRLFWTLCGKRIAFLELCFCYFSTHQAFQKVVFGKFPNLEELRIVGLQIVDPIEEEGEYDENEERDHGWERIVEGGRLSKLRHLEVVGDKYGSAGLKWVQLFRESPNLKIFILIGMNLSETNRILRDLAEARRLTEGRTLNITHLEISQTLDVGSADTIELDWLNYPAVIRSLETLGLPLETLAADFYVSREIKQRLLQVYSSTMKNFEIGQWPPEGLEGAGVDPPLPLAGDHDDSLLEAMFSGNLVKAATFFIKVIGIVMICVFVEQISSPDNIPLFWK